MNDGTMMGELLEVIGRKLNELWTKKRIVQAELTKLDEAIKEAEKCRSRLITEKGN